MNKKLLTVLIPFLNERDEVVETVKDVRRTAGNSVDIIVLNDHSTDNWNYEELLSQYNVRYIFNVINQGSAPSRDICVNNCKTPYFLFLDAHMRFYCTNWVERIVNMLNHNDRQILCMQTVSLIKSNNQVHINKKHTSVYGAFMPLSATNIQPDIKWNRIESNPDEKTQEVPMILGAAYAGSTRYWTYLHGMKGLKKYGTEEQFISLKVWLEGGRCVLLKDIVVGHIYREKSPYKRYTHVELYNKLWITSLLFPPTLRSKSLAIAKSKQLHSFNDAIELLIENNKEFLSEKKYYNKIFTCSFDKIYTMNRDIVYKHMKHNDKLEPRILKVAEFLENNISGKYGLFDGKMGQLLWFVCFCKSYKISKYKKITQKLWKEITDAINNKLVPWDFATGLLGIGWSIHFLYSKNLINELPNEILEIIDKIIISLDVSEISNTNIETGCAGILAYYSVRCRYSKIKLFNDDIDAKILITADNVIKNSNIAKELFFAYYCKSIIQDGISNYDTNIMLTDCIDIQTNFAENSEYWDNTLIGSAMSSTILYMNNKF